MDFTAGHIHGRLVYISPDRHYNSRRERERERVPDTDCQAAHATDIFWNSSRKMTGSGQNMILNIPADDGWCSGTLSINQHVQAHIQTHRRRRRQKQTEMSWDE